MKSSRKNFSGSQKLTASVAIAVAVILWIGGCGDFVQSKSTGIQAQKIFDDVSRGQFAPEPNIPMPDIYMAPPKIVEQTVGGAAEWKLFYFCRHHMADYLKQVVHDQFATQLFNKKGQSTTLRDYTVSSNPATNQLIVRCPTKEDVEAVLELLDYTDVPPIQVKIDCIISEIYADKTIDWETTLQIEEILGEDIWAGPSATKFGSSVSSLLADPDTLPAFPGASLREMARGRMGLKVGYWKADRYLALVDLLESQGYLKILMNPSLEIVNGKNAKVSSKQKVPLQQIITERPDLDYISTRTEYEDVIDSLSITPHVFADGYIGLETKILLGSKLTPEGVKQLPIITTKEIENTENRIRPGESLVIGGIRKTEERDVIRGVPFLKDIPVLGILFSGRDFEERVVETIFILTPRISTGGRPTEEILAEIRKKHEPPSVKSFTDKLVDPFGTNARKEEKKKEVDQAEKVRLQGLAEKEEARHAAREADQRAEKAETEATEAQTAMQNAEKLMAEAKQAKEEADKLTTDANKTKQDAQKAIAEAEKLTTDANKAKQDAQKAIAEAEKLKKELEQAKNAAQTPKPEPAAKTEDKNSPENEPKETPPDQPKAENDKPKSESGNA